MSDPIAEWSKAYDRAVGVGPNGRNFPAQRAKLLLAYHAGNQRKRKLRTPLFGGVLVAASLLVGVWWFRSAATHEEAFLNGAPIASGASVESTWSSKTLSFSGGTQVLLDPATQLRLQKLANEEVELEVTHGTVSFDVRHREGTTWTISAGAYVVEVVGTAFSVDRNLQSDLVKVHVTRGKVRVAGPGLSPSGLFLEAGERFESPQKAPSLVPTPWPKDPPLPPARADGSKGTEESEVQVKAPSIGELDISPQTPAKVSAGTSPRHWTNLARDGKFNQALVEARKIGEDQLLRSASGPELLLLGNSARFSGEIGLAESAYKRARQRASGSSAAALSAYYLARICADEQGRPKQAISWLRTYLKEQGSGALAESARARLMMLLQSQGDQAGAQAEAQRYLERYPSGPHSAQAKSLIATRKR